MARTGTEILVEKLIKMLGIDPQLILGKVDEIRKSVSNAAGDIAAIRRDQLRIMAHLNVPPEVDHNGRSLDAADDAIPDRRKVVN